MIGSFLQYGSCISCMANAFSSDVSSLEAEIDAALTAPPAVASYSNSTVLPIASPAVTLEDMNFNEKQLSFVSIKDQQIELLSGEVVRLQSELDSVLGYNRTPGCNTTAAQVDLKAEMHRLEHDLTSVLSYNRTPAYDTLNVQHDINILQNDHVEVNKSLARENDLTSVLAYNRTPSYDTLHVQHAILENDHVEVNQSLAETQNMYDALFYEHSKLLEVHSALQQSVENLQNENAQLRLSYDKIAMVERLQQAAVAIANGETPATAHETYMNAVDKNMQEAYENWQAAQRKAAAASSEARMQQLNMTNVSPAQWSNITPSEIQMVPVTLATICRDR